MAGVINKIRSKGVIVVAIIGLALTSFILSDLFQKLYTVIQGGDSNELIANIGGTKIKAAEFKQKVEEQLFLANANQRDPNAPPPERDRISADTWNQLINETIFQQEYDKLGLKVSDMEFKDMVSGANPDPLVQQVFGPKDQIQNVIKQAEKDPNLKFRVQQAEKYIIANRLSNKYNALIKGGVYVSKAEAKRKLEEEQKTINFSYLAVNYAAISDKEVKATDADYNEIYNENKEEFRIKSPEVVLQYVQLPKAATSKDSTKAREYLLKIKDEFQRSQADSAFAASRNKSSFRYDFSYKNRGDIDPMDAEKIAGIKVDSVVGPFLSGRTLKLIKLSDVTRNDTAPFVKIRHILIQPKGQSPADTMTAFNDFQATKMTVTKDNFPQKVMEKSDDQRSKMSGGDIGWYKWGSFGPNTELDKVLKKAGKGQIVSGKSAAGYHIVEILDRSTEAIRIATIGYDVEASSETLDSLTNILQRMMSESNKDTVKFNKMAKDSKLVLNTSNPIVSGTSTLGALSGGTVKQLISWSLMKDENTFFDQIYSSDNAVFCGYIKTKVKEGIKPMAMVKTQLQERVMARLKSKKIVDKLNSLKSKGDLEAIKNAYQGSFVNVAEKVSFASGYIAGLGQDPMLVGKAFGLKVNQISKPIVGKTGVFLVKVTAINEPEKRDAKGMEEYRISLQQNKRNSHVGKVQQGLKDHANVKDYRYKHGE